MSMLYVYWGSIDWEKAPRAFVMSSNSFFDAHYTDEWLTDGWAKRVIEEIDKSSLIAPKVVDSPWLDMIPITQISGGAKTLIIANAVDGIVINGNRMGDNCWNLMLELSKKKDIQLVCEYCAIFDWVDGAEATFINNGTVVNNYSDFNDMRFELLNSNVTSHDSIKWPLPVNNELFEEDMSWMDDV